MALLPAKSPRLHPSPSQADMLGVMPSLTGSQNLLRSRGDGTCSSEGCNRSVFCWHTSIGVPLTVCRELLQPGSCGPEYESTAVWAAAVCKRTGQCSGAEYAAVCSLPSWTVVSLSLPFLCRPRQWPLPSGTAPSAACLAAKLVSHMRIVPSSEPDAYELPSGAKRRQWTGP